MIRINLLESERATASKPKGAAGGGASAAGPYIPLIAAAALALLGTGYFWWSMSGEIADTQAKIEVAKAEVAKLGVEKAKKEELERKRKSFTDQVNLIERLKAEQGGPVRMLDEISRALPDFVWLTRIDQTGASLKISGEASNNNSIADFLNNLQRSGDGCDPGLPQTKVNCWFPEANLDAYREAPSGPAVIAFTFTTTFSNPEVAMKDAAVAAAEAAKPKPAAAAAAKK